MTAAWEEPWSRLLAFRQHLPEHYEVHESLIRTYHELLAELEQAANFKLQNFRIAEDTVCPKVVSASYATMRRPGRVNYSKDNYCERTNVLMKLDGLITSWNHACPSFSRLNPTGTRDPSCPTRYSRLIFIDLSNPPAQVNGGDFFRRRKRTSRCWWMR